MKKLISLIIIHWNTPEILKRQLEQLIINNDFQIIVVDNASEKSVDWIKKDFPQIQLIENKFNRGYAYACNQGVMRAKNKWLLFLNPDVEIDVNQIEAIADYAEKNCLNACSPTVGENYQKPLPTWFSLLVEFTPIKRLIGIDNFKNKTLFGGCLLIKKQVLINLGGWDERFFLWFEDSDLTKRLVEKNYKIGWLPQAVFHPGGGSFRRLTNQQQRDIFFHSMDVYARKHFSCWGRLITGLIKKRYTSRKLLPVLNNVVSITIPNLNKKLLEKFFNKNLHSQDREEEWIIITSVLNNQEVWQWRKKHPQVRFVVIEKNGGFAPTVNIGLRVSTGHWIGTVNDDAVIKINWTKDCLLETDEKIGSINPIIHKEDGTIESAGIKILAQGKAVPIAHFDHDRCQDTQSSIILTDATNAAAVIYNKKALNQVGIFDERFGSYLEDVDLSLRLSRAGYRNIVSLKSSVVHTGQASSKKLSWQKNWLDFKNWILVILKNWELKRIVLNFPAIVVERLRNFSGVIKAVF